MVKPSTTVALRMEVARSIVAAPEICVMAALRVQFVAENPPYRLTLSGSEILLALE
jgi:hypothetical protein